MRPIRLACIAALAFLPIACVSHTVLATEDRGYLERAWTGRERNQFLRLSFFVTPFFGDPGKRLLTALPPDEVRLLQGPDGKTIAPGPVQRILPAGTPVEIYQVEFPTAYVVPQRILYTPRTQPWVFVRLPGDDGPPLILVLRPQLKTTVEARAELERYLTPIDPAAVLNGYSAAIRDAIKKKEALDDMPADALERAWGYPERKQVKFSDDSREEEWTYPFARRKVQLKDDRVAHFEVPGTAPPSDER